MSARLSRLVRGLIGFTVISVLVVGVPWFLITFVGNPWPAAGVSWSAPLSPDALLGLIVTIGWLFWAQMVVALGIETITVVRSVRTIGVPGVFSGQQTLARRLVLMVVVAVIGGSPAANSKTPGSLDSSAITGSHLVSPVQAHSDRTAQTQNEGTVDYTVERGDTLWSLAQHLLGSGERWHEIADLNEGRVMPDGMKFRTIDHLRPGWTLRVPVGSAVSQADVSDAQHESAATLEHTSINLEGLGSLAAAGVVISLDRRRRLQRRSRQFGERIDVPRNQPLRSLETSLRQLEDPGLVHQVDLVLRRLSESTYVDGYPLPALRAMRVDVNGYLLVLDDPPQPPPRPFVAGPGPQTWYLPSTETADIGAAISEVPAYSTLVTVGHDANEDPVLVDLESLACVALDGSRQATSDVMSAWAVELATSTWAENVEVVVVGFGAELTGMIGNDRVRHCNDVGEVIGDLRTYHRALARLAEYEPEGDVSASRRRTRAVEAWIPRVILIGHDMTAEERRLLQGLAAAVPRMSICFSSAVVDSTSDNLDPPVSIPCEEPFAVPHTDWVVGVQKLPGSTLTTICDLLEYTARPAIPIEATTTSSASASDASVVPDSANAPVDDRRTTDRPGPEIRILGSVGIVGESGSTDAHRSAVDELAAYLSLHREGVSRTQLHESGVIRTRETRRPKAHSSHESRIAKSAWTTMSRLRRTLGADENGDLYFPTMTEGRYRLSSAVRSDWETFQRLSHQAYVKGPAGATDLEHALRLVRGRPFANRTVRTYVWTDPFEHDIISAIVDASHQLSVLRRNANDLHGARQAVSIGLEIDNRYSELLWRDAILNEHRFATGKITRVIEQFYQVLDGLDPDPETMALIERVG